MHLFLCTMTIICTVRPFFGVTMLNMLFFLLVTIYSIGMAICSLHLSVWFILHINPLVPHFFLHDIQSINLLMSPAEAASPIGL